MNLTWLESAQARGFDEVILLNERGEVAECTSANLFIANGSRVSTPPLSSGCLPGITREVPARRDQGSGIRVEEKAAAAGATWRRRRRCFITSTTRDPAARSCRSKMRRSAGPTMTAPSIGAGVLRNM